MHSLITHLHSLNRWVILGFLIVSIVTCFIGWRGKKVFTEGNRKSAFIAFVASHTQLLLGFLLWGLSPKVSFSAGAMKEAVTRFFLVEHPTMMIIAIVLITMGYIRSKKATDNVKKHKLVFWFYLIALLIILGSIPYPWQAYGAAWY